MDINNQIQFKSLQEAYKYMFSSKGNFEIHFLNPINAEDMLKTASKLVHFGWKKEAVPISTLKKSIITRFFETIFG